MSDDIGRCPACGQIVGSAPGTQTNPHQKPDSRETCPGGHYTTPLRRGLTMSERRWRVPLRDSEREAMGTLGIEPGFNDYSAECVLDAYRLGVAHAANGLGDD